MSKKRKRARYELPPVVTLRTLTIDFEERTLTIDGQRVRIGIVGAVSIPIMSGEAVFVSRGDMERIA